jgi:guanyl-specific ribonuclease Sa
MRKPIRPGSKLSGMLTAVLFAWLQVGCSSQPADVQVQATAQQSNDGESLAARHKPPATARHSLPAGVPTNVATVLHHIDSTHQAPAGYEGGRTFHNEGHGGEQRLPQKDKEGKAISYQEWDVNPKVHNVNRGAERLVTGSDGSAYYTSDHYRTFTKVR